MTKLILLLQDGNKMTTNKPIVTKNSDNYYHFLTMSSAIIWVLIIRSMSGTKYKPSHAKSRCSTKQTKSLSEFLFKWGCVAHNKSKTQNNWYELQGVALLALSPLCTCTKICKQCKSPRDVTWRLSLYESIDRIHSS